MDITYLGHSAFRISGKNAVVVTDPFDPKMVGLKFPKVKAQIVTVSHNHDDHNNVNAVSDIKKVVDGVGEYEIEGISIIGIPSYHDNEMGKKRGKNVIYLIEVDGVRICHLGDLGHTLPKDLVDDIGEVDVLMIPVGGEYTIGPADAEKVVRDIDPKVIIPMHYKMPGMSQIFSNLEEVDAFLSTMGIKQVKENKLTIRPGSLLEEDKMVVILEIK